MEKVKALINLMTELEEETWIYLYIKKQEKKQFATGQDKLFELLESDFQGRTKIKEGVVIKKEINYRNSLEDVFSKKID